MPARAVTRVRASAVFTASPLVGAKPNRSATRPAQARAHWASAPRVRLRKGKRRQGGNGQGTGQGLKRRAALERQARGALLGAEERVPARLLGRGGAGVQHLTQPHGHLQRWVSVTVPGLEPTEARAREG